LNIDRERLEQITGPGSYNLGTELGAAKPPSHFHKKTVQEKLMGIDVSGIQTSKMTN